MPYQSRPFIFIDLIIPYFVQNVYEVDINSDRASGVTSGNTVRNEAMAVKETRVLSITHKPTSLLLTDPLLCYYCYII
jgi:hypothetical protein